jgi:Raf kinase inhibitor-like YbhB/YbcL family protein
MKKLLLVLFLVLICGAIFLYFTYPSNKMILKSSAFKPGEFIPPKFTCDGEDVNPLLEIRDVPADAKSLALIVDDPDATRGTTWVHWLLWNIDPRTQYISEDSVPFGAILGKTDFGYLRYGGPCPPRGSKPHRYMFKLYALDKMLDLPEGSTKADLERAMAGHILAEASLVGLYGRK